MKTGPDTDYALCLAVYSLDRRAAGAPHLPAGKRVRLVLGMECLTGEEVRMRGLGGSMLAVMAGLAGAFQVFFGVLLEGSLAAWGAEIVRFALIFISGGRRFFVDFHAANRISSHVFSL